MSPASSFLRLKDKVILLYFLPAGKNRPVPCRHLTHAHRNTLTDRYEELRVRFVSPAPPLLIICLQFPDLPLMYWRTIQPIIKRRMSSVISGNELGATTENVLSHLAEILADRRFASAERNARFLRYVVERTLEGKADEIKETVIATEVYGRSSDYDPKTDSIVRVEATRLRAKLRSYYEAEGQAAPVRIHLPSGTYVPRFEVAIPDLVEEPATVEDAIEPAATAQPVEVSPASCVNRQPLAWAGIAAAVLVALSLQLANASKAVHTPHPEAVAAWREGVALLGQDPHVSRTEHGAPPTILRAIERLEFAVAKDPNLAGAWATLAEAYDYVFPYVNRDQAEDARRAEAAARRAVTLDSRLAAGHHMLGLILWMMKWDFPAAEQSYRRALELDPDNVYAAVEYADLLRETGRTEQAAALIRKSRAHVPALPQLAAKEAEIYLDLGRPDAAITAANAALQLNRTYFRAHIALGMAEEMKGNTTAALRLYEHVLSVDPSDRRALPAYGYALAKTGQHQRAREIAQRLEHMNANVRNCAFQVAVVYAGLGEEDRALDWLEQAWRTHQVHFPFATVEYRFRDLRDHPRFRKLLARAGLRFVS
jgi:tetratricopeptide (TPR) repeat protein